MYCFLHLGERGWLLQSACGWIYEEVKVSVCHWPGPPKRTGVRVLYLTTVRLSAA